jgi:hypothetical protein
MLMWDCESHRIGGGTLRVCVLQDGAAISFDNAIDLLGSSKEFRTWFIAALAGVPYASFFWETPPRTDATIDSDFEYVIVDAPMLASQRPDSHAFAEYFRDADGAGTIAVIPNLSGDAIMIVPRILASASVYTDLATFLRHGPDKQKHELLGVMASTIRCRLGQRPVWLSTSGLGVAWLHIRLDSRPKYYQYQPFTESGGSP